MYVIILSLILGWSHYHPQSTTPPTAQSCGSCIRTGGNSGAYPVPIVPKPKK